MHLRRSFALTAGVAVLAAGLSSCGFDYATDQPYIPAAGTYNKDATIDVMSAVVVAAQDDSGTFIASFSNPTSEEGAVERIAGAGDTQVEVESFQPIEVAAGELVNLAEEGGVPLTGDFRQGDVLTLEIQFDDGSAATLRAPVVRNCDIHEGLDETAEQGSTPTESSASGETGEHDETGEHVEHDEYSCELAEPPTGH